MKTKINFYLACLTAISFVAFASCDENDGDTTKPVITLKAPAEGDTLHIGEEVHLEMDLEDDVMLKSYKVNIHPNFNNHAHTTALPKAAETEGFEYNRSWEVEQRNAGIHHHEIVIDSAATPGKYHFMVYCTDAAGNEALVTRGVVLSAEEGEEHDHSHDDE
jgi:hypothetical protein